MVDQVLMDIIKVKNISKKLAKQKLVTKLLNETKQKISKANLGKVRSQEYRQHLSEVHKGKSWTEARRLAQNNRIKKENK